MRVLYVCPGLDIQRGGAITAAVNLAQAVSGKGVLVSIFVPVSKNEKYGYAEQLEDVNVKFFKKGVLSKKWTGYSPFLARRLNKTIAEFDLVHIHELWHYPGFAAYCAAKRKKVPFIVTAHGELTSRMRGYKALRKGLYWHLIQKKILKDADALHAITQVEMKSFGSLTESKNIFHIPNGLNIEEFEGLSGAEIFTDKFPQTLGKKIILFLGRIHPVKGLETLAKAFGTLVKKREDVWLVIAGPDNDGKYKKHIIKILEAEKALDRTIFTGMVTGRMKLALLTKANLFVLPSYSEVLGLSTLEAMVCGIPVVISKNCNFPEVQEHSAGKLIDMTAEELTGTLDFLLNNPAICENMGKNGEKLVREKYTWHSASDKMKALYEKVVFKRKLKDKRI